MKKIDFRSAKNKYVISMFFQFVIKIAVICMAIYTLFIKVSYYLSDTSAPLYTLSLYFEVLINSMMILIYSIWLILLLVKHFAKKDYRFAPLFGAKFFVTVAEVIILFIYLIGLYSAYQLGFNDRYANEINILLYVVIPVLAIIDNWFFDYDFRHRNSNLLSLIIGLVITLYFSILVVLVEKGPVDIAYSNTNIYFYDQSSFISGLVIKYFLKKEMYDVIVYVSLGIFVVSILISWTLLFRLDFRYKILANRKSKEIPTDPNLSANNFMDYLDNYGHLTFDEKPFNKIDGLIFASIAYFPFEDLENYLPKEEKPTLGAYCQVFVENFKLIELITLFAGDKFLAKKIIDSYRFKDVIILKRESSFSNKKEKQFAAITFKINTKEVVVAYRGTDLTFTGWKEDFNMATMDEVPSQKLAVEYLNKTKHNKNTKIHVVGHSKGGNLAVYGSTYCDSKVQEKIDIIYDFDGPGFKSDLIETEEYRNIVPKVATFMATNAVVGLLMNKESNKRIVQSFQTGYIYQHILYSWVVEEDDLVYAKKLSRISKETSKIVNGIINNLTLNEKEKFINILFDGINSTGFTRSFDVLDRPFTFLKLMNKYIKSLDQKDRKFVKSKARKMSRLLVRITFNWSSGNHKSKKRKKTQKHK